MTNRNDQLLPCPFCGQQPKEYDQIGYSSVKCKTCNFSIKVKSMDGPPYAPELWNTRAQLPAGGAVPYTLTEQAPFVIRDAQGRYVAELLAWDAELIGALLAAAPYPVSGEQKPVGEIVIFGSDLKEVSWPGGKMPAPGTKLYAAPPAAQDVSGLCELIDDVCEWFELRGLRDLNIYKALKAAHRAQAQGGSK